MVDNWATRIRYAEEDIRAHLRTIPRDRDPSMKWLAKMEDLKRRLATAKEAYAARQEGQSEEEPL